MKILLKIAATLLAIVSIAGVASAATSAPWVLTNPSDLFISPGLFNGSAKGITVTATSTLATTTFTGPISINNWQLSTSTTVCLYPDKCQFQATSTNDNAVIQKAINSLPAGTVYIKQGTYNMARAINFTTHKVALIGEGASTTILKAISTFSGFGIVYDYTSPISNIEIGGITFDSNQNSNVSAIQLGQVNNVFIHDNEMNNKTGQGWSVAIGTINDADVEGSASYNINFNHNFLHDNDNGTNETVLPINVRNSHFDSNYYYANTNTAYSFNYYGYCKGDTVNNNSFYNTQDAIFLLDCDGVTANNNTIIASTTSQSGISVANSHNVVANGNVIKLFNQGGIGTSGFSFFNYGGTFDGHTSLFSDDSYVTVVGNTIQNGYGPIDLGTGNNFNKLLHAVIADNVINNPIDIAINMGKDDGSINFDDIKIDNNILYNSSVFAGRGIIQLQGDTTNTSRAKNIYVTNNHVYPSVNASVRAGSDTATGIYISAVTNVTLYGNILDGTGEGQPPVRLLNGATLGSSFTIAPSAVIGIDYIGTSTAPNNGLIVEGTSGFGTSSPFAQFSIATPNNATGATTTLFMIASSTAISTTTLFSISNIGSTTLGRFGSCSGTLALTTNSNGTIVCGTVSVASSASSTLLADFNTFTGQNMFLASTTIGNGTGLGGLTVSGNSTTTLNSYVAGTLGIGTFRPTEVNANSKLTVANTGAIDIIASTTDNTTLSTAIIEAYAPGSRIFIGAHGANQVTTQYGIVVGGWGEVGAINSSFGTSNGLLIGTRTSATPIVFGTNSLERLRILSTGNIGLGTTSPFAKFSIAGLSGGTTPLFAISSSTATATTTVFDVDQNGNIFAGFNGAKMSFNNTLVGDAFLTSFTMNGQTNVVSRQISLTNIIPLEITDQSTNTGDGPAFCFSVSTAGSNNCTAGIAAFRTGSAGAGGIFFSTKTSTSNGIAPITAMLIDNNQLVGVGSTTPFAKLSVQGNANDSTANQTLFAIGSSTATATSTLFSVKNTGHLIGSSTTPVLSACGTSPIMVGDDTHGTVTTGATANGCTVTFNTPYTVAPVCTVTSQTGSVVNTFSYAVTNTTLTATETAIGGGKFDYICYGLTGI